MVIQNIQRKTVVSIGHSEFSLKVGLPHPITCVLFKSLEGTAFEGFFLLDTAVFAENVVDGFYTRQLRASFAFQNLMDGFGSPAAVLSDSQNPCLNLGRRFARALCGPSAAVSHRHTGLVTFKPFVAGAAADAKLPAQCAEVAALHCRFCKFFSLFVHSSSLPRHPLAPLFRVIRCPYFNRKTVYHVFAQLYTMLLLSTHRSSAPCSRPEQPDGRWPPLCGC